jgi:hypothetical protein
VNIHPSGIKTEPAMLMAPDKVCSLTKDPLPPLPPPRIHSMLRKVGGCL